MHPRPTLLVLALAGLAWPAGAAPDASAPKTPPRVAAPRLPTVDEALALAPPAGAAKRSPVPARGGPTPAPLDGDDNCRSACAKSYYFCAADEAGGDCGGSWSQCAAACDAPNLAPGLPEPIR